MYIELLGLSGVKITSEGRTILLSPPTQKGELPAHRMKADIVVLGAPGDEINIQPAEEKLFIIDSPGEYETKSVFFSVLPSSNASLICVFRVEGVYIAHLGRLQQPLSEEEIKIFESSDVLLIPAGGNDVLDAKQATRIVSQLEPRIVIPMHTAKTGLKTSYAKAEYFLKEMGSTGDPIDRIKVTKASLPQDTMDIIHLKN